MMVVVFFFSFSEGVGGGVFASEVYSICVQHSAPAIAVYHRCKKSILNYQPLLMLPCIHRGSGYGSRFAFAVDVDPLELETIIAIHIRGNKNYLSLVTDTHVLLRLVIYRICGKNFSRSCHK